MQYITIITSVISLLISAISVIKIFTSITERFVKIETKFNMFKDTVIEQNKESENERNALLQKIHEHDCLFAKMQVTLENVNLNTEKIEKAVREMSERIK